MFHVGRDCDIAQKCGSMFELNHIQNFDNCRIAGRFIVVGVFHHDGDSSVELRERYKTVCCQASLQNDDC